MRRALQLKTTWPPGAACEFLYSGAWYRAVSRGVIDASGESCLELKEVRSPASTLLPLDEVAACVVPKGTHLLWTTEDERKALKRALSAPAAEPVKQAKLSKPEAHSTKQPTSEAHKHRAPEASSRNQPALQASSRKQLAPEADGSSPKRARKQPAPTSLSTPPFISLLTGDRLKPSRAEVRTWESTAGQQSAARRGQELDCLRLVGSLQFSFEIKPDAPKKLAEALGVHDNAPPTRRPLKRWYSAKKDAHLPYVHTEPWCEHTGELTGRGLVSVNKLIELVAKGQLMPDIPDAKTVLDALHGLLMPDPALYGCPLLHAAITPPAVLDQESSAKARGKQPQGQRLELKCDVYVTCLLFCFVGASDVQTVFKHLKCHVASPVMSLPSYPPTFYSVGGAAAEPFTLQGVLKSCEHVGYREAAQPAGIKMPLKQYQAQTLAWMMDMEDMAKLPRGINGLFWEERAFADGGAYYHFPALGEVRLEAPPLMWGGLLCEEMGLGKTLEVTALIIESLRQGLPLEHADGKAASRATLVIVPPAVLEQWGTEIGLVRTTRLHSAPRLLRS